MRKERAVTLVEIIVSMIIFSLVLLGTAGVFVTGKRYLKRAQYEQEALNFAREKLEELEALDFDDFCLQNLGPGNTYPTVDCPDVGILPNGWTRTWEIDWDDPVDPNFKFITVTVEWQDPLH